MTTPAFLKVKEARKKYQEEMKKISKTEMKEMFDKIFEEHPELQGLYWTQYTPYFNDGDACVFGLGALHYYTNETLKNFLADPEGYSEEEFFEDPPEHWEWSCSKGTPLQNSVKELEHEMNENEQVFEDVFGDHVQVTVLRGNDIEVETYYHD
jgi:acyl carrier protein phosphodiesterase